MSDNWDRIGFQKLFLGSLTLSLLFSAIVSIVYGIGFNLVIFVVIQIFVIIATTMIWPALNSK